MCIVPNQTMRHKKSTQTIIALLGNAMSRQQAIIIALTGKGEDAFLQVLALNNKGQAYDDQGMTVPDDVTLLQANDKWDSIRRLPVHTEKPRNRN